MPANMKPIFPITQNVGMGKVLTANTGTDGTGTLVTVFTAGANGSIVDSMTVVHLGTNVATVLRLFVKDGASYSLFFEETIAANTIAQNAKSVYYNYVFDPMLGATPNNKRITLKTGQTIVATVGTVIAAGLQLTLIGGDY